MQIHCMKHMSFKTGIIIPYLIVGQNIAWKQTPLVLDPYNGFMKYKLFEKRSGKQPNVYFYHSRTIYSSCLVLFECRKPGNLSYRMLSGVKKLHVYDFVNEKFTVCDGIEMTHITEVRRAIF